MDISEPKTSWFTLASAAPTKGKCPSEPTNHVSTATFHHIMKLPAFGLLATPGPGDELCFSYARRMHPDPRFYKYRWWIFWELSPVDGQAFLQDAHAISTAEAMTLIERLERQRKVHWVYNKRLPRLEANVTPFDPMHSKWQGHIFAPPLSKDGDSEWNGHR